MPDVRYFEFKSAGVCTKCGKTRAEGSVYCERHRDYHRRWQRAHMQERRAADPVYRELERFAVRKRMRKLRARPDYVRPDRPVRC